MTKSCRRPQCVYAKETKISVYGDIIVYGDTFIMKPWTNKSSSLGIVGLLLVGLGASICFLWPTLFHQILQKVSVIYSLSSISDLFLKVSQSKIPKYYDTIVIFLIISFSLIITSARASLFTIIISEFMQFYFFNQYINIKDIKTILYRHNNIII